MQDIRYSDDVKESITLAGKLARKENRSAPADRDYLKALVLSHRKYGRLDALLAILKVPPGQLKKQLGERSEAPPANPTSDLLKNAEIMAKTSGQDQNSGRAALVDVEHLLKALSLSPDPAVSRIFKTHDLSAERIEQAVSAAQRGSTRRSLLYFARELVEVVTFVLVFLILIKGFLGELRLIPSESMVPGLQISDRLVIERVTRWWRPYQRGDVLVFYPPMTELKGDPWSIFLRITGFSGLIYKKEDNIDVAYIKRLIGLPGDRVEVRPNDGVYVNGERLNEPYISELANTCTFMRSPFPNEPGPVCRPVEVPAGKYYLMGDNRNLSLDSRYWGFADGNRIIGRAVFRIWPPDRFGPLPDAPYQGEDSGP